MGKETVQISIIYVIVCQEKSHPKSWKIKEKLQKILLKIHYHLFPFFF